MSCVWKDKKTGMCKVDKSKHKRNCRFLLETQKCPLNDNKFCGTDKNDNPVYRPVIIKKLETWWYTLSPYKQDQVWTLFVCLIIILFICIYRK